MLFWISMKNSLLQKAVLFGLVKKELRARYAGSVLGFLWAFLNPLLLALVVGFVFTNILKVSVERFYLFVISGMIPWSFLAGSLSESVASIPAHAPLLKQFSFPREFIPLATVLLNFMLFICGLLVVLPAFIFADTRVVMMLPVLLLVMFLQLLFVSGLSLLLAVSYVYFRDVSQLLLVVLLFWLWLTPVFYSVDMIPDKYVLLFEMNPMGPYIRLYRNALFSIDGHNWLLLLRAGLQSIVVLVIGYVVFCLQEHDLVKRI